jgi:predicted ATP-grasp superfamily ATP-dependent carboligase
MEQPVIVVLDCNRNGLAAIRSFGRAGAKVIAVDHVWRKAAMYSKYVTHRYVVPRPHLDRKGFLDGLMKVAKQHGDAGPLFILPVNDEYVRTLSTHWDVLGTAYTPLFEIDEQMLDKIANKVNFSDFCMSIGIPQPRRYTSDDVRNDRVDYPIIFKPDERRSLDNIAVDVFRVKICENAEEAQSFLAEVTSDGIEVIIQQFIPGEDSELYTGGVAAFKGRMLGCFTGKKVRQFPPMAGQAAWAEAVPNDRLVEYSTKIVEALGFTGIAQIEFKQYQGELYVIEMNPRSWSWHGLAQPAGVDLPKLVLEAAQGEYPERVVANDRNGIFWHFFLEDFVHNFLLHGNIGWKELLRDSKKAAENAFYDRNDPIPGLLHLLIDFPIRFGLLILKRK